MTKNKKDFKTSSARYSPAETNSCLALEQVVENVKEGNGDYFDWGVAFTSPEPFDLREVNDEPQEIKFEFIGPLGFTGKVYKAIRRQDPYLTQVDTSVRRGSTLHRRMKEIDPDLDLDEVKTLTVTGPDVAVSMWANGLLGAISAMAEVVKADIGSNNEEEDTGGLDPSALITAMPVVINEIVKTLDDEFRQQLLASMIPELAEIAVTGGLSTTVITEDADGDFHMKDGDNNDTGGDNVIDLKKARPKGRA